MIIVYESKTGFTKKYADMLAANTKMEVFRAKDASKISRDEEIIFLGWMKAGRIQGLNKLKKHNVKVVCGSGTAKRAEPDEKTVKSRNKIESTQFFYLRGGCLPLKEIKGMDKLLLSMFVKMLKSRKDQDEMVSESITMIENGCDEVKKENLTPVLEYLSCETKVGSR